MSLITYLTRVHFADGVLDEALAAETGALDITRPLVVTDEGLRECGLVERLLDAMAPHLEPTLFFETSARPDGNDCALAAQLYLERGCDGIIGFGGGSSIDLSKAIGLLASHGGELASYAVVEGGTARIRDILPPLIAIPTTAGAGSEVTRGAVAIVDDGRRLGFISPHLIPRVAICDPTLTVSLPGDLTAGTGMDALTHCVETYISRTYNPPADGIAIDGIGRAAKHLHRAVDNGGDMEARREMMAAALDGALALQKGLGGVHAMSHALGSLPGLKLHHGKLNAILLPHVLEFNAPAVSKRYDALCQAMGFGEGADICMAVVDLRNRIGLPSCLSELGVGKDAVDAAAALAESDFTNGTNPRMAGEYDYRRMMMNAL